MKDQSKHTNDLRGDEERYRTLVEHVSDWIWEVDDNGVYTFESPRKRIFCAIHPKR